MLNRINNAVTSLTSSILNVSMYELFNLSLMRFFVNNKTLFFFLIFTSVFPLFNLFLTFIFDRSIRFLMLFQFFFIAFVNVMIDKFLLRIIFEIRTLKSYSAFYDICLRSSLCAEFIIIYVNNKNWTHSCLFSYVKILKYVFNVWFILFI